LPTGTYKVLTGLTLPINVSLYGDGPAASIIDGSGCTLGGLGFQKAILRTPDATVVSLPSLSVTGLSQGSNYLQFSSAHGLCANDLLWVSNTTQSWTNNIETYERKGEILRVGTPSPGTILFGDLAGSTVATLQGFLYDNYSTTTGGFTLCKITNYSTCSIKDLWIKAPGLTGLYDLGLQVNSLVDSVISNVKSTQASSTAISVRHCYNVAINDCTGMEDAHNWYGLDYGLSIASCQHIKVNGGYYSASRHAETIGSDSFCISRDISFQNVTLKATTADFLGDPVPNYTNPNTLPYNSVNAADCHTSSEYIRWTDCSIDGGVIMGGDRITLDGCVLTGLGGRALAVIGPIVGGNRTITNNKFTASNIPPANIGAFIDMGSQGGILFGASASRGGIITIKNNTFEYAFGANERRTVAGNTGNSTTISLFNNGYTGENISIDIQNNTFHAPPNYPQGTVLISTADGLSNTYNQFQTINFSNNLCNNVGGMIVYPAATTICDNLIITSNKIINAYDVGFYIRGVRKSILFDNNYIDGTRSTVATGPGLFNTSQTPVTFAGLSPTSNWNGKTDLTITNNVVKNGLLTPNLADSTRADYYISNFNKGIFYNNVYGTDTKSLTVSSNAGFVLNEQITGALSGVTAYVTGFRGITLIGIDKASSSNFTTSEVITGNISGTSTNVTTNNTNKGKGFWVDGGNSMWIGTNVSLSTSGLTDFYNGVTTTTPINVSNVSPSSGISASINSSGTLNIQNTGILSFNGLTGAVNGVSTVRGITGNIGLTGSPGLVVSSTGNTLTFTNSGVLSVNSSSGAIINVAKTDTANIFTQTQTFRQPLLLATSPAPANGGGLTFDMGFNTLLKPTLQGYNEPCITLTPVSNTITLDLSVSQVFFITLSSSINTLNIINTPAAPNRSTGFTLIISMNTPFSTITWGSKIRWAGNTPPVLSSAANKVDIFSFVTIDAGTSYFGFVGGQNYPIASS